ncbi:MAG: hypothetical protein Q4D29_11995 [Lachnospiraceae bacterium]|nr:hypothetical protein [Lachnospiraceae bacterium]
MNILWYQSPKISDRDIVSLNGQILSSKIERFKYFNIIKSLSDKALDFKKPWCGRLEGMFFVKGYFDARDEKGRLMSFMFMSDETNGRSALMRELEIIGYTMTTETRKCVFKTDSTTTVIYIIMVIIGLLILTILLINLNSATL